jgi:hypothetical protein
MPRRRGLIATAICGAAAWPGGRVTFLAARGAEACSTISSGVLLALCSELRPPATIGKACLEALPAIENPEVSLTRIILGEMRAAGRDCSSASALAHSIRERSRDDFRDGRIVTVDGWMLSLTETRVYALAALLPQPHETVE